jgi:uncharacterized protein
VLAAIEARAKRPIAELFDFIAGTSTGGILALGLTLDAGDGTPRYSAAELRDLYVKRGREIFPPRRPAWRRTVRGLFGERFPQGPLERVLEEYMGDAMLQRALVPVLVPAYEIELRTPFFFRSVRAKDADAYDFRVRDVARATSAAPTTSRPPGSIRATRRTHSRWSTAACSPTTPRCARSPTCASTATRRPTRRSRRRTCSRGRTC